MRARIVLSTLVAAACGGSPPAADAPPAPDAAIDAIDAAIDAAAPPLDAAVDAAGLELQRDEPPGSRCRYGGVRIERGLDDGVPDGVAGDGALTGGEVDDVSYACAVAPPDALAPSGLDALPATPTCRPPAGTGGTGIEAVLAFPSVRFPADPDCVAGVNDADCGDAFRPVALRQHPTTDRFYVAQQNGRILSFAAADAQATVALDLRAAVVFGYEPGLLQLDFDPRTPSRAFVTYVTCAAAVVGAAGPPCPDGEQPDVRTVVVGYQVRADGSFDPASAWPVLDIPHPATEHNGGGAVFGPDGLLYVGVGDGGAFPPTAPQDPGSLLGKILRLDVHAEDGAPLPPSQPYRIPADNPFASTPGARPEVFIRGVRNPWRFDVVIEGGAPLVWIGDVGLVTAEEIDRARGGDDLGWPTREGPFCRPSGALASQVTVLSTITCSDASTPPVAWFRHAEGVSLTGGFVYRGLALGALRGSYLYADFTTGAVSALTWRSGAWRRSQVVATSSSIVSFGRDRAGEAYLLDWWSGAIKVLRPTATAPGDAAPLLSMTGCVDPAAPWRPAAGAIPLAVNAPLVDGADAYKERWLYLSGEAQLLEWDASGDVMATPGTVLVKNFDLGDRRVETRVEYLHDDWTWSFWSYRWRPDGSDAVRVDEAATEDIDGQPWHYPDRSDCTLCHGLGNARPIALRVEQLNGAQFYATTGRWANQLDTLSAIGKLGRLRVPQFDVVPMPAGATLPRWPEYDEPTASLDARAAAYLRGNCAHCHRAAGPGRGQFDLTDLSTTCDARLSADIYDDPTLRVVTPGDPSRSMLWRRLEETVLPYRMPYGRTRRDPAGSALIGAWIAAGAGCPP